MAEREGRTAPPARVAETSDAAPATTVTIQQGFLQRKLARRAAARDGAVVQRQPREGGPGPASDEQPMGYDATGFANGDGTNVYGASDTTATVLMTLAKNGSIKVTARSGTFYVVKTANGGKGYVQQGELDVDGMADAVDAMPANPFQAILDKATGGPADVDGEKAWLLDNAYWLELLTTLPGNQRTLGGVPIGGMTGWLHVKVKPVVLAQFGSKPDGPNNCGLVTYQGNYLLYRHAIHHNHNPTGGPANTGTYDAMEGYKLPADIVAKYEARKAARKPPGK